MPVEPHDDARQDLRRIAWAKAFYRRAKVFLYTLESAILYLDLQARLLPLVSSYDEDKDVQLALADLTCALTLKPSDPVIRQDLTALRQSREEERRKRKEAYQNKVVSHSPSVFPSSSSARTKMNGKTAKAAAAEESSSMSLVDAERILQDLTYQLEREQESAEPDLDRVARLEGQVNEVRDLLERARNRAARAQKIDLENLDPQTVREALQKGIDLQDSR